MSTHTKAFAKGYGVFLGIIILWAAWLGLFWLCARLFFGTDAEGV